jgi:uncharacterized protein YfkK (UPF0435 family)
MNESFNIRELKAIAKHLGITGYSSMNKEQLLKRIEKIRDHRKLMSKQTLT